VSAYHLHKSDENRTAKCNQKNLVTEISPGQSVGAGQLSDLLDQFGLFSFREERFPARSERCFWDLYPPPHSGFWGVGHGGDLGELIPAFSSEVRDLFSCCGQPAVWPAGANQIDIPLHVPPLPPN
jgi:hypothetical protein